MKAAFLNVNNSPLAVPRKRSATALAVLGAALTLSSLAQAQTQKSPTERIDELEKRLEQSLKQIEQLSTEVSRLRNAKPAPAAAAAPPAQRSATVSRSKTQKLKASSGRLSKSMNPPRAA